jgi:hypothetical protein
MGVATMSERTLRHLIGQHLTDFLEAWYRVSANAGRPPTERDFALWLAGDASRAAEIHST